MYIFIASVILVSFIALCFFKKRFWENRYLVLFISGCVALVATLTTNYATRGRLDTTIETLWNYPIQLMSLDSSLIDNSLFTLNKELRLIEHVMVADSTHVPIYGTHLFHYNGDGKLCVGYAINNEYKAKAWKNIYIAPSTSDTVAYIANLRLDYKERNSKWITDYSLPHIKTIKCLYLPPVEYAAIPDSLIRELPFKL